MHGVDDAVDREQLLLVGLQPREALDVLGERLPGAGAVQVAVLHARVVLAGSDRPAAARGSSTRAPAGSPIHATPNVVPQDGADDLAVGRRAGRPGSGRAAASRRRRRGRGRAGPRRRACRGARSSRPAASAPSGSPGSPRALRLRGGGAQDRADRLARRLVRRLADHRRRPLEARERLAERLGAQRPLAVGQVLRLVPVRERDVARSGRGTARPARAPRRRPRARRRTAPCR